MQPTKTDRRPVFTLKALYRSFGVVVGVVLIFKAESVLIARLIEWGNRP